MKISFGKCSPGVQEDTKFVKNKNQWFAVATRVELCGRGDADMSKRVTSKYRTISTNELAKSSFRLTWIALKEAQHTSGSPRTLASTH